MVKATKPTIEMKSIFGDKLSLASMINNVLSVESHKEGQKGLFWTVPDICYLVCMKYANKTLTKAQHEAAISRISTTLSQAIKHSRGDIRKSNNSVGPLLEEKYFHGKGRKGNGFRVGFAEIGKGINADTHKEHNAASLDQAETQQNLMESTIANAKMMSYFQLSELMFEIAAMQSQKHTDLQVELSRTRKSLSTITGAVDAAKEEL